MVSKLQLNKNFTTSLRYLITCEYLKIVQGMSKKGGQLKSKWSIWLHFSLISFACGLSFLFLCAYMLNVFNGFIASLTTISTLYSLSSQFGLQFLLHILLLLVYDVFHLFHVFCVFDGFYLFCVFSVMVTILVLLIVLHL